MEDDHPLVLEEEIKKVALKPVSDRILKHKKDDDRVNVQNLNQSQLRAILSVHLKPIPLINKKRVFDIRHPVLRELQKKTILFQ